MGTQTQKVVIHNHVNVGTKKSKRKGRRRGTSSRVKKSGSTYDNAKTIVTPADSVDRQMMMHLLQANRGFSEPMLLNDFNASMYQQRALNPQGGYALHSVPEMPHESVKMLGDKIDKANEKTQATFSQGYKQLQALSVKQHDLEQKLQDVNSTRSDVGNLHDFDDISSNSTKPSGAEEDMPPPSSPPSPPLIDGSPEEKEETTPAPPKSKPPKERRSTLRPEPVPRQNKKGEWVFGGRKPTKPDQIERRNKILLAVVKKIR